jgi:2-polyprenyl-6-methoxyphenol hydroxylase-like FAD-dependent oxidoreductase
MKNNDPTLKIHKEKFSHSYTQISLSMEHVPKEALHAINIWPRKDHCMVGMPNSKETLKCTLILPNETIQNPDVIENALKESFPYLFKNMSAENNLKALRFADLYTVEMDSYYDSKLHTILIGDAAHTILPFMGQGVNLGLEDALLLYECIIENNDLKQFSDARVKEGLAATILSAEHYVTIIKSSSQKPPTFWNSLISFIKKLFRNETPLAVIQLDFEGVPHSSLVEENKLRFK